MSHLSLSTLLWRHNDHGGVSNHQPHSCLLNRLFRRRSKKTPKLRVTGLCAGNLPGPVNSPHKGPVTRKMVPFNDVIMSKTSDLNFSNFNSITLKHKQSVPHFANDILNCMFIDDGCFILVWQLLCISNFTMKEEVLICNLGIFLTHWPLGGLNDFF